MAILSLHFAGYLSACTDTHFFIFSKSILIQYSIPIDNGRRGLKKPFQAFTESFILIVILSFLRLCQDMV